jgi:hypothetical protein
MLKSICKWIKKKEKKEEGRAQKKDLMPTRDEMLQVFFDLCEGRIPTRIGIAFMHIRETHGHNRSPFIDQIIRNQGGSLGDPYCMWGMQEAIDELCIYYGINRQLVSLSIPKGGSTQQVFARSAEHLKKFYPIPMSMVFWRQNSNPTRGHVGMVTGPITHDSAFQTFEFNTAIQSIDEVVRDGEGAGFLMRRLNGTGTMKIIGYVDVYQAICEVLQKQERMA